MEKRKPLWDILSENRKKKCLDRIVAYFLDERNENVGLIVAEDLLDVVIEGVFSDIYNKGVLDAEKVIKEKNADIESELNLLLRSS
ncbi:hypothetical protein A2239_03705 [Candidatus Uhrbacteria bacterium RIFOXYA2_FULL_40_9]|nr:MAG: hypothetical protein UT94_C0018G0004 [Candidatus Uhrbacteria bacterium GW2011_GWF2_40_263]OGL93151.1 MAG: hypothetical protein A2239_03705 [Candidatus Uhrbacteria bacterium RIFOXYA2_FULL_40_9]OGL96932.1 MAG: hypothetical protein A2332_03330 [Candidatus Uhrbacteria bacterium RIFOXYB2_FULL_41_18]HBK35130.1 hypothetical protein [Candidatus Uhrbacteria bacterium]HCB56058.1 hypothetical protein [Candidatus Uhrbacteria bacterium]